MLAVRGNRELWRLVLQPDLGTAGWQERAVPLRFKEYLEESESRSLLLLVLISIPVLLNTEAAQCNQQWLRQQLGFAEK